jgi:hypothetical protein
LDSGDLSGAVEGFERALAADSSLPLAWLGLAVALSRMGDLARAREAASKAQASVRGRDSTEGVPGAEHEVTAGQVRALAGSILGGL